MILSLLVNSSWQILQARFSNWLEFSSLTSGKIIQDILPSWVVVRSWRHLRNSWEDTHGLNCKYPGEPHTFPWSTRNLLIKNRLANQFVVRRKKMEKILDLSDIRKKKGFNNVCLLATRGSRTNACIDALFERDSCSQQHAEIIDHITWLCQGNVSEDHKRSVYWQTAVSREISCPVAEPLFARRHKCSLNLNRTITCGFNLVCDLVVWASNIRICK